MRDTILRLYAASHEQARSLASDITEDDFRRIVNGKSPAWLIGHLAIAGDFAASLCNAEARLGDWSPLFAPDTQPAADNPAYPDKAALLGALSERHAAASDAFRSVSDEHLASELPMPEWRAYFPTIADAVVYLLAHHEPYHLGQLQQWKRAAND